MCGLPGTEVVNANMKVTIPPPAILKPVKRWTGKQLISTLMKHLCPPPLPTLNLEGKSRTPNFAFGDDENEHKILFYKSELLRGVLDKSSMGSSTLGIVHAVYELYDADRAGLLLGAFGRVFTNFLQQAGHTCSLEDLTLTEAADEERKMLIHKVNEEAAEGIVNFLPDAGDGKDMNATRAVSKFLSEANDSKVKLDAATQRVINKASSNVIKACIPNGLEKKFPYNNFSMMVLTGAKGSAVNQSQISCFLGQQALEGQRVPLTISGKTLPSFPAFDPTPRAGGFVRDRFLTGVRPQEYYFHCMAGREGLVDTAVKTSRSGYLQRCLVKHLEELKVHYDHTVRDANSNVIQFLYGDDGIDPMSSALLGGKENQLDFLLNNTNALKYRYCRRGKGIDDPELQISIKAAHDYHALLKASKLTPIGSGSDLKLKEGYVIMARRKHKEDRDWSISNVLPDWYAATIMKVRSKPNSYGYTVADIKYADGITSKKIPCCLKVDGATINLMRSGIPDPALSTSAFNKKVSEISESLHTRIDDYSTKNNHSQSKLNELESLMAIKYTHSQVAPGEAVGCIAAQSVGEPSTQMTLNTFHLAGHGGANVTLGIPRLREIIMTASKHLKTPTLTVPISVSSSIASEYVITPKVKAHKLSRRLGRVTMFDLLHHRDGIVVSEGLKRDDLGQWTRVYKIKLTFESPTRIESVFDIAFEDILEVVKSGLLTKMRSKIDRNDRRNDNGTDNQDPLREFRVQSGDGTDDDNAIPADDGSSVMSSSSNSKNKNKPSSKSTDIGDSDTDRDDDDDDDDDNNNDDLGTLNLGNKKKEVEGYDEAESDMESSDSDKDDENDGHDSDNTSTPISSNKKNKNNSGSRTDDEDEDNSSKSSANTNVSDDEGDEDLGLDGDSDLEDLIQDADNYGIELKGSKKKGTITYDMSFPAENNRVLMVELIEECTSELAVKEIPGVTNAFAMEVKLNDENVAAVQTEGLNFEAIWNLAPEEVQHNHITSNDIHQMLQIYGVEAARQSIVSEIIGVFGVYGINVNPRHLSLIADFMTRTGGYVPLNRGGMSECTSPFVQMSFETTCSFLTKAAIEGGYDNMQSSSAQIVLGNVAKVGTGAFDVCVPVIPIKKE